MQTALSVEHAGHTGLRREQEVIVGLPGRHVLHRREADDPQGVRHELGTQHPAASFRVRFAAMDVARVVAGNADRQRVFKRRTVNRVIAAAAVDLPRDVLVLLEDEQIVLSAAREILKTVEAERRGVVDVALIGRADVPLRIDVRANQLVVCRLPADGAFEVLVPRDVGAALGLTIHRDRAIPREGHIVERVGDFRQTARIDSAAAVEGPADRALRIDAEVIDGLIAAHQMLEAGKAQRARRVDEARVGARDEPVVLLRVRGQRGRDGQRVGGLAPGHDFDAGHKARGFGIAAVGSADAAAVGRRGLEFHAGQDVDQHRHGQGIEPQRIRRIAAGFVDDVVAPQVLEDEGIVAVTADEFVVATAAAQRVVTGAGIEDVVARSRLAASRRHRRR